MRNKIVLSILGLVIVSIVGAAIVVGYLVTSNSHSQAIKQVEELTKRSEQGVETPIDWGYPRVTQPEGGFVDWKTGKKLPLQWSNSCLLTSKLVSENMGLEKWNAVWVLDPKICVRTSADKIKDGNIPVYDGEHGNVYNVEWKNGKAVSSDIANSLVTQQGITDLLTHFGQSEIHIPLSVMKLEIPSCDIFTDMTLAIHKCGGVLNLKIDDSAKYNENQIRKEIEESNVAYKLGKGVTLGKITVGKVTFDELKGQE